MARVTGPLFSQTAAGNMAKGALQFRADRWGSHVYKPQAPAKQTKPVTTFGCSSFTTDALCDGTRCLDWPRH